jgi:hypothetical protein
MRTPRPLLVAAIAIAALVRTAPASADLGPPYITPEIPSPQDVIVLHVQQDFCNAFNTGLITPQITQVGSTIGIVVTGDHQTDPEFCIYQPVIANVEVGRSPPGTYSMVVTWRRLNAGGDLALYPVTCPTGEGRWHIA